jgi:molybdopterin synthase catalytic subunit
MARLSLTPFEPQDELKALMAGRTDVGGLASFVGYVRNEDARVLALRLDHYPGFTETWLDEIETSAQSRFDVLATHIVHRAGTLTPGEPIVLVAAISLHRKSALECVDYLMDRLKTDAPFWKQEMRSDGNRWIEPRPQDHLARQAWDQAHD